MSDKQPRLPSIGEVLVVLVAFLAVVFSFVAVFDLPIQLALLISWFLVIILGVKLGYDYEDLEKAIYKGIHDGLGAVLILIVVGGLIGTWIAGGIVPTLIYYGLDIIHPNIFLLATLLICSLTSLATGTSWGSAGTSGLAMMGIGAGLGYPAPIVAGAVISGVYLGDKISPLSDSTNLTASMCKVDVIDHVRSMLTLMIPAWLITGTLYTLAGFMYDVGTAAEELERVEMYMETMADTFSINPLMLIPALIVIGLLIMKKPPFVSIAFGALLGVIWATLFQGMEFFPALNTAWGGFSIETGVEFIDDLLTRGGIEGMLGSIAIILFGLGFGGLLEYVGALRVIVEKISHLFNSPGKASIGSVIVGIFGNMFGSAMYVSIIVPPKIMQGSYDKLNLKRTVLSRNTEVGGTLTSAMVPWSDNGIFMAALLGVPVFSYIPFMWLAFVSIALSIIYGFTGLFMWQREEGEEVEDLGSQ